MNKRIPVSIQPHRLQLFSIIAGGVVLLLIISSAWLLSGHSQSVSATGSNSITQVVHMDASWARGFDSLKSAKYASDAVVLGTITSIAQVQRDRVGIVFTDFVFRLDKVMWDSHHKLGSPSIMIHQTGGVINTTRFEIDEDPLFQIGEQAILFLVVYSPGHAYVNGGPTGRFLVEHGVVRPRNSEAGMATYIGHAVSEAAFLAEIQNA